MNIKISQMAPVDYLLDGDLVPMVRGTTNYNVSGATFYSYLSGDLFKGIYNNYNNNSASYIALSNLTASVYNTVSTTSSNNVTISDDQTIYGKKIIMNKVGIKAYPNVDFTVGGAVSALNNIYTGARFYTLNSDSDAWTTSYSYINSVSSNTQTINSIVTSNSSNWNSTYSSWNQTSAISILSNTTTYPGSTAVKNIIAISQAAYANLLVKDPYTLYIVV
jgi:hypothetical protein